MKKILLCTCKNVAEAICCICCCCGLYYAFKERPVPKALQDAIDNEAVADAPLPPPPLTQAPCWHVDDARGRYYINDTMKVAWEVNKSTIGC